MQAQQPVDENRFFFTNWTRRGCGRKGWWSVTRPSRNLQDTDIAFYTDNINTMYTLSCDIYAFSRIPLPFCYVTSFYKLTTIKCFVNFNPSLLPDVTINEKNCRTQFRRLRPVAGTCELHTQLYSLRYERYNLKECAGV